VQAYLAPGSTLEVHSGQRVSLRAGEAWFMVKQKSGAFAVETPEASVHVVGTTFNVSMEAGGLAVRTHSGEVRVEAPAAEPATVAANQQWTSATRTITRCELANLPERSGLLWDWARAGAPKKGYYPSAAGAAAPAGPRTDQPVAGSVSP
jgi:ferric-dicitrate binding protein FerR (iron transport regulator)